MIDIYMDVILSSFDGIYLSAILIVTIMNRISIILLVAMLCVNTWKLKYNLIMLALNILGATLGGYFLALPMGML